MLNRSHRLPMAEADARIFVSVAETGSFTAAASHFDLTPSAVSKAVTRLEAALGVKLVMRTTRALHLTAEGKGFHEGCARAFQLLADATEEVTAGADVISGTVRLGLPTILGTYLVGPRIRQLLDTHPQLRLDVVSTMRLSDMTERGLDLMIMVGPLPDSSLHARPLGYAQFVTVAAPETVGADPPANPSDLDRFRCLPWLRPDNKPDAWRFKIGSRELLVEPRTASASDDMHHLIAMAMAGAGICQVPLFAVAEALGSGKLARVLEDFDPAPKLASFVFPASRTLPRRVRVVMEQLAEENDDIPGTSRRV